MRSTSAKLAWVEYMLARGAEPEGLAVWQSVQRGGTFADYRKVFEALGYTAKGPQTPRIPPPLAAPSVQSTGKNEVTGRILPLVG